MAFLNDGRWIPDVPMNLNQRVNADAGIAPQPMLQSNYPANINLPQSFAQSPMIAQQLMASPNFNINPAMMQGMPPQTMAYQGSPGQFGQAINGSQAMQNINQAMAGQGPMQPAQNNIPVSQNPQTDLTPLQTYNMMPAPQPKSLTQSVNMSDPQARQNYLNALNKTNGQAAANNAWRNPYGQQGQGPQAGFQGFQQNGGGYQGQAPQQYQQPQQGQQLGWAQNNATGGQVSAQQQAGGQYVQAQSNTGNVTAGGQGGVQGQPGYKPGGDAGYMGNKAASDINSKQNIQAGDNQLQEFLDSLGVYDYEYKDPKYGDGRRISPMAQEIESTTLGKAAISTNEEGYKIVDYGKLGGTMLASLALLNHKYNKLEEELKSSIKENLRLKGKIK